MILHREIDERNTSEPQENVIIVLHELDTHPQMRIEGDHKQVLRFWSVLVDFAIDFVQDMQTKSQRREQVDQILLPALGFTELPICANELGCEAIWSHPNCYVLVKPNQHDCKSLFKLIFRELGDVQNKPKVFQWKDLAGLLEGISD